MIVPIVLSFASEIEAQYLFEFFSALRIENNGVVIASEDYNKSLEEFINLGRHECYDFYGVSGCNERKITQEDIDQSQIFFLDVEAYKRELMLSSKELNAYMVSNRYKPFEEFLDAVRATIEKRKIKIDAFLMFRQYKSVDIWASENNVKIIYYDLSTFRYPVYKTQFYIDFTGFLNNVDFEKRFEKFKKEREFVCALSRIEIIALMLTQPFKPIIEYLDYTPARKCTVFFQDNIIDYQIENVNKTNSQLLEKAIEDEEDKQIVVRTGPVNECEVIEGAKLDNNKYAFETIASSQKTYSRISNVSFETMLWNRKAFTSEKGLYSFIAEKSLNQEYRDEVELFLSFATFGLYIPQEKLRDAQYLKWRCEEHSEVEIYMDNLLYWLRTVGLNEEFLRLTRKERILKLLKIRGYSKEYIKKIVMIYEREKQ